MSRAKPPLTPAAAKKANGFYSCARAFTLRAIAARSHFQMTGFHAATMYTSQLCRQLVTVARLDITLFHAPDFSRRPHFR